MAFLKNFLLCLIVLLIISFAILLGINLLGVKTTFLLSYILTIILVILFYWFRRKTNHISNSLFNREASAGTEVLIQRKESCFVQLEFMLNYFVLPFSFLILPFVIYLILCFIRALGVVNACPGGWEIFAVVIAYHYSFPFIILTFSVSLVFELTKRFRK